jgi:hypothetical protein
MLSPQPFAHSCKYRRGQVVQLLALPPDYERIAVRLVNGSAGGVSGSAEESFSGQRAQRLVVTPGRLCPSAVRPQCVRSKSYWLGQVARSPSS